MLKTNPESHYWLLSFSHTPHPNPTTYHLQNYHQAIIIICLYHRNSSEQWATTISNSPHTTCFYCCSFSFTSTLLFVILSKEKSDHMMSLTSIYQSLPVILRIRFKILTMASKPTQKPSPGTTLSWFPIYFSLLIALQQHLPSHLRDFTLCLENLCLDICMTHFLTLFTLCTVNFPELNLYNPI